MSDEVPGTGRIFGLIVAAILLFVGAALVVVGGNAVREMQAGFYIVGWVCIACALGIFCMQSGGGSAAVGLLGLGILGAFVFFFVILLSRG